MEKKRRKSKEGGIKESGKDSTFKQNMQSNKSMLAWAQPKPIQKPGILTDKDRQILDDVQNIIWDPDRLNKFKNDGNAAKARGLSKGKKPVK